MNDIDVVHADLQHLDPLTRLFDAYRIWYGSQSDPDGARNFLSQRIQNNESQIFLVKSENDYVAFTQLYPLFSSVSMASVWLLNDLYVAEEHRRLGYGQLLLETAVEFARETGAIRVELATELTNSDAQSVYDSNGWQRDSEFVHYKMPIES